MSVPSPAPRWRLAIGLCCLAALPWSVPAVDGQALPLIRDYPGAGPYECPAVATPAQAPGPADLGRAARLVSDANQALALGDLEESQAMLAQATQLDPTSAAYAYQHARTLEALDDPDSALLEYCRALALGIRELGVLDTRERIDTLYDVVRERIPEEARLAFVLGLERADMGALEEAVEAFTRALEAAPEWGAPLYNRGVVYERLGRVAGGLADYRRYMDMAPTDIDPVLVRVSARIGQLEGAASVATPSPAAVLALGVVPGMGQFYSGRPRWGAVTAVGAAGAIAVGLLVRNKTTLCAVSVPSGDACPSDLMFGEVTERPYLWYGIGAAAIIAAVGAWDAVRHARGRRAAAAAIAPPQENDGPSVSLPLTVTSRGSRMDLNLLHVRFR